MQREWGGGTKEGHGVGDGRGGNYLDGRVGQDAVVLYEGRDVSR